MKILIISLLLTVSLNSYSQTINYDSLIDCTYENKSYDSIPMHIKEFYWDAAEHYADGMESESYYLAVTDFFNGAMVAYLTLKFISNDTNKKTNSLRKSSKVYRKLY